MSYTSIRIHIKCMQNPKTKTIPCTHYYYFFHSFGHSFHSLVLHHIIYFFRWSCSRICAENWYSNGRICNNKKWIGSFYCGSFAQQESESNVYLVSVYAFSQQWSPKFFRAAPAMSMNCILYAMLSWICVQNISNSFDVRAREIENSKTWNEWWYSLFLIIFLRCLHLES